MKNKKSIFLLFLANFISGVSQGMSMIAIPWYFTQRDDMVKFGLIYMITNIIALFWVPYAGILTDRFSRKKILTILMTILGFIIIGISFFGFDNEGLPWIWVASVFGLTFLNYNIHYPTLYAFVQEMSEPRHYGRVTSMIEIQGQLATVLAGAASALLLSGIPEEGLQIGAWTLPFLQGMEPWKIYEIFLIDGISYFIGAFVLLSIPFASGKLLNKQKEGVKERLKQGIQYLKDHRYVTIFGFASYVVFLTVIIEGFYLLAPYVNHHLVQGADIYSAGKMMYALGAFLSGFLIRLIFRSFSLVDSVLVMTAAVAITYIVFFFTTSVYIFLPLGVLLGMSNAGIRIQRVTYLFSKVPNNVYGRVNSTFNLGNIIARVILLALFSLPFIQDGGNIKWAFVLLAVLCTSGVLVLLFFRDKMIIKS